MYGAHAYGKFTYAVVLALVNPIPPTPAPVPNTGGNYAGQYFGQCAYGVLAPFQAAPPPPPPPPTRSSQGWVAPAPVVDLFDEHVKSERRRAEEIARDDDEVISASLLWLTLK